MSWFKGNFRKNHKINLREIFKREEISLQELFTFFWERKGLPLLAGLVFLLLGLVNTLSIPDVYDAKTVIIPEGKSQKNTLFQGSGLTNLLGLGNTSQSSSSVDITSPTMFPTLINSNDFMLDLLQKEIFTKRYNDMYTLEDYLLKHDSRSMLQKFANGVKNTPKRIGRFFARKQEADKTAETDTLYRISDRKIGAISELKELIVIENSGALTEIRIKSFEPEMAVILNHIILDELIQAVIELRTGKEREDLMNLEIQTEGARENFEEAQTRLAKFRDANRGVISALARTEEERLSADFQVKFNIYNSLAVKLESQKTNLQENTPVFTIFEKAYVPARPRSISYLRTVLVYFIFGFLIGFLGVIFREVVALKNG